MGTKIVTLEVFNGAYMDANGNIAIVELGEADGGKAIRFTCGIEEQTSCVIRLNDPYETEMFAQHIHECEYLGEVGENEP